MPSILLRQAWETALPWPLSGNTPTLENAAHEAAHYVQNIEATRLQGGVGEANDIYERHADRVADAVVSGESAASLLDQAPSNADALAANAADSPLQMAGGAC